MMIFSFFLLLTYFFPGFGSDFESEQKTYARVRSAYSNREKTVLQELKDQNLDEKKFQVLWLGFKEEQELQMWLSPEKGKAFKFIKSFEICALSGKIGPKRKEGDWQIPEGFYHINRFNPVSKYHLALQVNYPNASDLIFSKGKKPGGDIMIHGACITIGCLPMTNEGIEEIYLYCIKARRNGQNQIPVYLFPCHPEKERFKELLQKNDGDPSHVAFWKNLQTGFLKFKKNLIELKIKVSPSGTYLFE